MRRIVVLTNQKEKWNTIPLEVKVSTAYAVCSVLQKGISFITLPLFTRLLTQEQFGQYTVYNSWLGIFSIILTLNLAYGSFSTAMVKFENRRDEYISSVEGICVALSILFLVIYFPFERHWNKLLELPTFLVIIMVAEIICSTSIQLWSGKKRFEFKYKSVVIWTLISSVTAPIVAVFMMLHTEEKGYARIVGYALVTIVIGGAIFLLNLWRGKEFANREFWKYALQFNIPLLAYYFSQVIFNQSDRIMISHICGTDTAALYGVAYNLAIVLSFVLNAINGSYVPWLYRKIEDGKMKDNQKIACGIAMLMGVLLLVIIWFAPEIIEIVAGKSYHKAVWVVAPVAMSQLLLFYSQLFINVEFYYEEKRSLVWASIGAAVINIVLNLLLIPRVGFVAAGYTTWISYFIFVLANYGAMKKIIRKRNIRDELFNYRLLFGIIIGFTFISFLGVSLYQLLWVRIIISLVVLAMIIYNRNRMRVFISEFKK